MKKILFVFPLIIFGSSLVGCEGNEPKPEPTKFYNVTFILEGKQYGDIKTVEENHTVEEPDEPTKPKDHDYRYEFDKWYTTNEYEETYNFNSPVTNDITLYGKFNEDIIIYHHVTFMSGDVQFGDVQEIEDGEYAKKPENNPTKEGNVEFSYPFKEWRKEGEETEFKFDETPITETITLIAVFEQVKNQYTITFKNADSDGGKIWQEKTLDYGTPIKYESEVTPSKDKTPQYEYEFAGWEPAISEGATVTGNAVYTAKFTSSIRKYDITWKNYDGTDIVTDQIEYDTTPSCSKIDDIKVPEDPDIFSEQKLVGWEPAIAPVSGPQTYKAKFEPVPKSIVSTINLTVPADETKCSFEIEQIVGESFVIDWGDKSGYSDHNESHSFNAGSFQIRVMNAKSIKPNDDCKNLITAISLGEGIAVIDDSTFKGCSSLSSVNLSNKIKTIGVKAFENDRNLSSINLPESLTSIGESAFHNTSSLNSVIIPPYATLGNKVFTASGVSDVTISQGVTQISSDCFDGCSKLEYIEIPSSVSSIYNLAFSNSGLKLIDLTTRFSPPILGNFVFGFTHKDDLTILVSTNSLATYKKASGWSDYADQIVDHIDSTNK